MKRTVSGEAIVEGRSSTPISTWLVVTGTVHLSVNARKGRETLVTSAIDLTITLPLSNLDVNVLATALPSRLEIVFWPPPA